MNSSNVYKIEGFLFYPQKNLLVKDFKETAINETINKILILFCTSNGNVVTRDEIASKCWENRVVTDDSIRQAIKKLRISLQESEETIYIETIRGKGYRFIIDINLTKDLPKAKKHSVELKKNPNKFTKYFKNFTITSTIFAVLFVIMNSYAHLSSFSNKDLSISSISRVTFEVGNEYGYSTAINGNDSYVILEKNSSSGKKIIIRNSQKKLLKEIYPSDIGGYVSTPSFNKNGDKLLYLNYSKNNCSVSMYNINNGTIENIIPCTKTDGLIAIDWMSDNEILYSSSPSLYDPLRLKKYNIDTKLISYISNPTPGGRGDFTAKSCNSLKILSIRDKNWKEHEIFLREKDKEINLKNIVGNAVSLDWTNDCNYFFYNNRHGNIYLYDIIKEKSKKIDLNIPTDSSIEYNNFSIYVSGNRTNKSTISFINLVTKKEESLFISSGKISHLSKHHNEEKYAFISNRTGKDQIWISDENIDSASQLSYLSKNENISGMQWDTFNNIIYYSIENNLYAFDIAKNANFLIFNSSSLIRNFYINGFNLLYTRYERGRWEIVNYDINSKSESFPSKLEISHIKVTDEKKIYLSDQTGDIYEYNDNYILTKIYDSTGDLNKWAVGNETIYLHDGYDIFSVPIKKSTNKLTHVLNVPKGIFGDISIVKDQVYVNKYLSNDTHISKYKFK
jgi:DNA-binding winged helix-turn-helix (wHTH) protein